MKTKFTKKYVILNSFQDSISGRPCAPKPKPGRRFGAFTLAEVLITLGIIGVVAAMTIPTLINNYEKTQYVVALKKAYTEINQALVQMAADNGCVGDLACTGLFEPGTTEESFGNELVKYFKVVKNCESTWGGPTIDGCFSDAINTRYDGSGSTVSQFAKGAPQYKFITADGMSMSFFSWMNNCEDRMGNLPQTCGNVAVDINGLKKPNRVGRDVFYFYIYNKNGPLLYPYGGPLDEFSSDTCGNKDDPDFSYDPYCTEKIVYQGWKMDY